MTFIMWAKLGIMRQKRYSERIPKTIFGLVASSNLLIINIFQISRIAARPFMLFKQKIINTFISSFVRMYSGKPSSRSASSTFT